jgi:hypothetical protein
LAKRTKIARPQALVEQGKRKLGRPSSYSEEVATRLCQLIADGSSLRKACEQDGMPDRDTVRRWLNDPEMVSFRGRYARAKDEQAEHLAEEIIELADTGGGNDTNRARLMVDARKWVASKLLPKKYGERLQADVSGQVSIVIGKDDAGVL